MTVASSTSRVSYSGNGSTTAFSVPFYFLENAHLRVILRSSTGVETVQVITSDYTVSGEGSPSGGTITMLVAPALGETIVIVRNVPRTQETDYTANDPFPADSHERALDKLTMVTQQMQEELDRSAKLPVTSSEDAAALVDDIILIADNVNNLDTVATNITNVNTVAGISANVTTVAGISGNVTTVAGISANVTSVAGNATNINTVATNISDVSAVAAIDSDVSAVAAIDSDVTIVAADGTDIGTVAGISANVTTVAGIAANVTTVAGISADVTTVAGIDSEVTAVAGNETNIDAVATNLTEVVAVGADLTGSPIVVDYGDLSPATNPATPTGAIGAVYSISSEIQTVAGIDSDVTTVAGIDGNVTTVAGISGDVTTVAGISGNVTTVAGISTDVTDVAAIDADVTAVAAIDSEIVIAATNVADITNFADVYQGPSATAPTLRNDGSALQLGDLYFNTALDEMNVYTSTGWVVAYIPTAGFLAVANNLSDLNNAATARTNLGLSDLGDLT